TVGRVTRPARHGVAASETDVEQTANVTLRALREAAELLHFGQCHRSAGGPSPRTHAPTLLLPLREICPNRASKAVNHSPAPRLELNHGSIPPAITKGMHSSHDVELSQYGNSAIGGQYRRSSLFADE